MHFLLPVLNKARSYLRAIALPASLIFLPAVAEAQLAITAQPEAVVVPVGETATFAVTATGASTPAYQWRRNGHPLPGATLASLTVSSVSQGDNDFYDVAVSDGSATVVSQRARLLATLPSYPGKLSADPTRSLRLERTEGGNIGAQAALPDGRYYLAGTFARLEGGTQHGVMRFKADHTRDDTFASLAFDVAPQVLVAQPDGRLLVGGSFQSVGGAPVPSIIRLNTDGSRDQNFLLESTWRNGISQLGLAPDGSIYAHVPWLTRFTPSGALDATFTSPRYFMGPSGINASFFVDPTGAVYVYGSFDRVNTTARKGLARVLPGGVVDPDFNPGTGANSFILSMCGWDNGQVVIAGDFTSYNGVPVGHIARLNLDGSLDGTFATGAGFSQQVGLVVSLPDEALFVGTSYNTYKGTTLWRGVRLSSTGEIDMTVAGNFTLFLNSASALAEGRVLLHGVLPDSGGTQGVVILEADGTVAKTGPSLRFPGQAKLLAHLPGGQILVAGDFRHVDGTAVPYIVRLNANLTRDTTFPAGPGPTSPVVTGLVQPDGKIVLFCTEGMLRLNANGTTDTTFAQELPWSRGFAYNAPPIALSDGTLLVATDARGGGINQPGINGLVVLDSTGQRLASHPLISGVPAGARIFGMKQLANRQVLLTGEFATWGGVACDRGVLLNLDGSVDPDFKLAPAFLATFDVPRVSLSPWGPATQSDGRIIAMSRALLARFKATDGTLDPAFGGAQADLFSAGTLLVQPDNRIIMQALSTRIDQLHLFKRFTSDGATDETFAVEGTGWWTAALLADNGELLTSDGSGFLHRYIPTPPAPTILAQPVAKTITYGDRLILSVVATGSGTLTYQWLKDGLPISGATKAELDIAATTTATRGFYSVRVRDGDGTTTSRAVQVTVLPLPMPGFYFNDDGVGMTTFALFLRPDHTGAFLGLGRTPAGASVAFFSRRIAFKGDRTMSIPIAITTAAGTEEKVLSATISADGELAGTLGGTGGWTFRGRKSAVGEGSAFAGFYQAGEVGSANAAYAIMDRDRKVYALVIKGVPAAASGYLPQSGALSFATGANNQGRVDLNFVTGTSTWSATIAPSPAEAPVRFSGANNDARENVEKLINISTRTEVTAGATFTAGFVVIGDKPKPVLMRAIGPTLSAFDVPNPLPSVHLEIYHSGRLIAASENWGDRGTAFQMEATAERVGAFALPRGSRDASLLLELAPGDYTMVVRGQKNEGGVALAEAYDATEGEIARHRRIVNISTLAPVGAGGNVLISGFAVNGTVPKRMLVRAAGPSLARFGVGDPLPRPTLTIFSGKAALASNAGWLTSPDAVAIAAAAQEASAFEFLPGSADAALLITLEPGTYTTHIGSLDGTKGVALIEVYELP